MHGGWWRATSSITTTVRLNSAVGYITPKDMLAGRQQEIHAERDRKLDAARKQRQIRPQQAA
jgi:putative transposase